MPANLREPFSLLTVTGQAMTKSAYPLQKSLPKNVGVTKWSRSVSNYFGRSCAVREEWGRSLGVGPGENSLQLILCRLLSWAREPPRQQGDRPFGHLLIFTWGLGSGASAGFCQAELRWEFLRAGFLDWGFASVLARMITKWRINALISGVFTNDSYLIGGGWERICTMFGKPKYLAYTCPSDEWTAVRCMLVAVEPTVNQKHFALLCNLVGWLIASNDIPHWLQPMRYYDDGMKFSYISSNSTLKLTNNLSIFTNAF